MRMRELYCPEAPIKNAVPDTLRSVKPIKNAVPDNLRPPSPARTGQ